MGHVLATEFQIKSSMDIIQSLAAEKNLTDREKLHVDAVKEWSAGWDMYYF